MKRLQRVVNSICVEGYYGKKLFSTFADGPKKLALNFLFGQCNYEPIRVKHFPTNTLNDHLLFGPSRSNRGYQIAPNKVE